MDWIWDFSWYVSDIIAYNKHQSLLALNLGQTTGTRPPSCLLLKNRLCMSPDTLKHSMKIG